jgi:hypothetical protein
MQMQMQTRCSLCYYCQAAAGWKEEVEERCTDLLWSMRSLLVLVLLQIAFLLLPAQMLCRGNNLGCLEADLPCKDRRLVMFGWMMDIVTIVRCWGWHFGKVECALALAWWCLSALVLRREVETRNAVGPELDQAESALVAHLMIQIGLVQQCMPASSQLRKGTAQHRWSLDLFQH